MLNKVQKDMNDSKTLTELEAIASSSRLGRVKVGANLTVDPDGTLNASGGGGTIPDASTTAKGIVQLEDSWTSTSVTTAPTSKALKAVKDHLLTVESELDSLIPPAFGTHYIYVANGGNDANDGSAGEPVKTLERAVELARMSKSTVRSINLESGVTYDEQLFINGMSGGTVYISGGYAQDSVVNSFNIQNCTAIINVERVSTKPNAQITEPMDAIGSVYNCSHVSIEGGEHGGTLLGLSAYNSRVFLSGFVTPLVTIEAITAMQGSFVSVSLEKVTGAKQTFVSDGSIIIGSIGAAVSTITATKRNGGQIFI